ncbi:unnamed protein product [Candida verbasci]|uniref:LicD/FKTN/FKRP nucleotidyltransferase domain-containing protein n=1 Tax=Candida verbasci TaxID=1227364 RepID=A0A9W4TVI6_9ASCO|nr:unnamed protein product [Candida verbasci]
MDKLLASPKLSIPQLSRRKKKILKIPLLIFFLFNTLYITTYYLFYQSSFLSTSSNYIIHVPVDDSNELPQISTTNINYTNELAYLLKNSNEPKFTTSLHPTEIQKSGEFALYQDPRVTFGTLFNIINNQTNTIPFHWADWIDLSYLNNQINKPQDKKIKCQDIIPQLILKKKSDREKCKRDHKYFGCINVSELTEDQLTNEIGLRKEELPGFVQFQHTMFTSTDYVRNLQGKSYVLSSMPIPFKVIFLNDKGNDLIYDVFKSRLPLPKDDKILDPTIKFNELVSNYSYNYHPKPYIKMDFDLFNYSRKDVYMKISQLKKIPLPSVQQHTYLNSLTSTVKVRPAENPETRFFHESTMKLNRDNSDNGWHYDWRFFNGRLSTNHERTSIILERLLRNWFKFSTKYEIISWIAHGPLLSWYWNGGIFPFDNDLDIQMPMKHLAKLGEFFNNTLVVEDLNEGFGKYLIEVGTFVHNRNVSKRGNHIDARFIDVDTGIYIDITGLSVSGSSVPIQYYRNINDDVDEGSFLKKSDNLPMVNDRRQHFYNLHHLSPLKLSMLNGVPCYLPNSIVKRLKFEYPNGSLTKLEFNSWYFVNKLSSWIHESVLKNYIDFNYITKSNGKIDKELIKSEINQLSDEQIYKLLTDNRQVLIDYYLSLEYNNFHNEEIRYLFTIDETKNKNVNDLSHGKILDTENVWANVDYINFLKDNVKLHKPLRESLFQFERINNGLKAYYEKANKELNYIAIS